MVVIQLKEGKIRGKKNLDRRNIEFYTFHNIPYAEPPVGPLRFKAPRAVKPWDGIRDGTEEGSESVSRHLITRKFIGTEDCLNLNVYTPKVKDDTLKPVMFWIHGGIFMTGSNKTELFGPEFLIEEDVVLVTINYRLGVLGFLSLEDSTLGVPGNAGFKDMVMALRWVQNNIISFRGDPNNVTVFGESAGSAAAHLLMLSPMAKGLFHKVIGQSGSALNPWVGGKRSGHIIGKQLGFHGTDDKKLLEFLMEVPPMKLLAAQIKIDTDDFVENDVRYFGLVIEKSCDEEAFMDRHPMEVILTGQYNHVPLIMGYNEREGMAIDDIVPSKCRKAFFENMELSVPLSLNVQRGSTVSKELAEKIRRFYFGNAQHNREEHLTQYYDLSTDTAFLKDIYSVVKHHSKTSKKPVYFYKMTIVTELNYFKRLTRATTPGVYHGDDLGYLFKTIFTPEITPGSIEDVAQKRFTRLWANFARYSDPTPHPPDSLLNNVKWKAVDGDMNYLEIGTQLEMKTNPDHNRMKFWEEICDFNPVVSKL